jgi:hypothetical protein
VLPVYSIDMQDLMECRVGRWMTRNGAIMSSKSRELHRKKDKVCIHCCEYYHIQRSDEPNRCYKTILEGSKNGKKSLLQINCL